MRKESATGKKKFRAKAREIGYGKSSDATFLKCSYTRYADDFVIGISGPRALAERVRNLVARFLKQRLSLTLSQEKTIITRAKGGKIPFLGYLISHDNPRAYVYKRRYGGKYRIVKAYRGGRIRLQTNLDRVIANLHRKGFCERNGKSKPNFFYFQYPQSHTVNQTALIVRGIANYFRLADDFRQKISNVSYIVRESISKMFAAKFKLKTRAKVYAKAGKDLSKPIKSTRAPVGMTDERIERDAKEAGGKLEIKTIGIPFSKYREIPQPDTKPLARNWKPRKRGTETIPYPLTKAKVLGVRGRMVFKNAVCANCGSTENIEMHHVRKNIRY